MGDGWRDSWPRCHTMHACMCREGFGTCHGLAPLAAHPPLPTCPRHDLPVQEYCPCGDRCTNQQFTKREYAALDVLRAGAKGFGLFTRDGVRAGQFIVEYVGEVLEEDEYQRRKEYYIASNQRHYYFMNIGNGEVIDACRRVGKVSRGFGGWVGRAPWSEEAAEWGCPDQ